MSKRDKFNIALKEEFKAKGQVVLSTIRLIMAELKSRCAEQPDMGKADGAMKQKLAG